MEHGASLAAIAGNVDALQWLTAHNFRNFHRVCYIAALYGRLGVLQWARLQTPPIARLG